MTFIWVMLIMAAIVGGELVRRRRPWAWATVRDTGITVYQEHEDGRRRVRQHPGCYQPIDRGWVSTGRWSRYRPPPGPSAIPRKPVPARGGEPGIDWSTRESAVASAAAAWEHRQGRT